MEDDDGHDDDDDNDDNDGNGDDNDGTDNNDDNDGNNFGLPISRQLLFFSDSILLQTHQKKYFLCFPGCQTGKGGAEKKPLSWLDLLCWCTLALK